MSEIGSKTAMKSGVGVIKSGTVIDEKWAFQFNGSCVIVQ